MRIGRGLPVRVFTASFVIIGLLSVVTSAFLALVEWRSARDELLDDALVIKERLGLSLMEPVWNFQRQQVDTIVQVEMHDERLAYVYVWDEESRLFSGFARDGEGRVRAADGTARADPRDVAADRVLYANLERSGFEMGVVELGLDYSPLRRDVVGTLVRSVARSFGVVIIGLLLILTYGKSLVLDPIAHMGAAVSRFADKDFSVRAEREAGRDDVIGELARAFNRMADMIQGYSTDLEELVRDRTARLIEAEKMAFLGGLTAGVAHEINTPVGIGVTAASHLRERVDGVAAALADGTLKRSDMEAFLAEMAETSDILMTNLKRAGDFVASFKNMAADQANEEIREIDVRGYVEDVLFSLRPRLKKTPHRVVVDVPEGLRWTGSPGILSQILTNLVVNSLNHAYPNGGAGVLTVRASIQDGRFVLDYSDDGCGIPRENLSRIFQPFFTTMREKGGTGLGLYILSNIVTKLGGTIGCVSDAGKGARFTVSLPERVEAAGSEDG